MLGPMDIPGAAATGTVPVPWLVLGVLLGVGLVVLVGLGTTLLLHRRPDRIARSGPGAPAPTGGDDLPGFLESPPGSATPDPPAGWAVLAAPPAAPPAAPTAVSAPRAGRDTLVAGLAMAVTAVLLLGAAAAVAATWRSDGRPAHHRSPGSPTRGSGEGAEARLTFGGLVLEPRAVGVTATYPVVEISADGDRARARVEFPTFNCLSAAAPVDPVAAGCTPSVTEYGELHSPDLVVTSDGNGFRVTGRFPTEVRPNGSAPVTTGRVYELRITVTPAVGTAPGGWQPADGVLELGSARAETVDGFGVNVLRSPS
jgi:hypothetical protein